MVRADVYAAIKYQNSSNKKDKFEAFMEGYKYAHLVMKKEMTKFTMVFSYQESEVKDENSKDS